MKRAVLIVNPYASRVTEEGISAVERVLMRVAYLRTVRTERPRHAGGLPGRRARPLSRRQAPWRPCLRRDGRAHDPGAARPARARPRGGRIRTRGARARREREPVHLSEGAGGSGCAGGGFRGWPRL